jgi:hypothetical protein
MCRGKLKRTSWKRPLGILIVIAVATLIVAVVYLTSFSAVLVSGVVDHKAVVGINDQASRTLLVITSGGVVIKDPALVDLFQGQGPNLVINETLDQKMHNRGYSEIFYLGSIRVSTNDPVNGIGQGETLQYYMNRDDFNRLTINGSVSYEVDRFQGATITKLHG